MIKTVLVLTAGVVMSAAGIAAANGDPPAKFTVRIENTTKLEPSRRPTASSGAGVFAGDSGHSYEQSADLQRRRKRSRQGAGSAIGGWQSEHARKIFKRCHGQLFTTPVSR